MILNNQHRASKKINYLYQKNMKYLLFVVLSFLIVSCKKDNFTVEDINKIDGYWEIFEVVQDGKAIKTYTQNEFLDYFELQDSIGFRKKVKPVVDGTYLTNSVVQNFKVNQHNNEVSIEYDEKWQKNTEVVLHLSDSILILKDINNQYHYKKYKPLQHYE